MVINYLGVGEVNGGCGQPTPDRGYLCVKIVGQLAFNTSGKINNKKYEASLFD
jgi:hypothetical protein